MNAHLHTETGDLLANQPSVTIFTSAIARGIVHHVDLVGRDLAVLLPNGLQAVDIPPDCPIVLNGEHVKLRMVQPGDNVLVTFRRDSERRVAHRLDVQPDALLSQSSSEPGNS